MKTRIAHGIYLAQNLAIPALIYFLVSRELSLVAYITVLISKWRIFAVSPHFWLPNIRSNASDIIVGLSTVALMSSSPVGQSPYLQIVLVFLYAVWLLIIKPRSGNMIVAAQAFIAQFYGLTALFLLADHAISEAWSWIVIPAAWLVGRSAARHFLS